MRKSSDDDELAFDDIHERVAYLAMYALTDAQRESVMGMFCCGCFRYTGGVETCYCTNDD